MGLRDLRGLSQAAAAGGGPAMVSGLLGKAALGLAVLALASGSFFIVSPSEMAGVRRLGTVTTEQPIGSGLHFKLPFIDTVDRLETTLNVFRVADLTVYTVDNQWVKVSISMTYRVPPAAVFHLLYKVGAAGNFGVAENISPVVADRALRIFARHNTVRISEEREQIANDIFQAIAQRLRELFLLEVVDVQINKIEYSPTFVQSVEAAVKAKNDAIAAENTVNRIRYEGEQRKVAAQAEAAAAIARAEGEKQAAIKRAEGEAQSITLRGEADARALAARGEMIGRYPTVVDYERVVRWNGQVPTTVLGGEQKLLFGLGETKGK